MKVTFIHHSCFCVEIEKKVFIFDYFRGDCIPEYDFKGVLPDFSKECEIYVFSSHHHRDHFDMEVLYWRDKYPNIQYIFAKDIKFSDNYLLKKGISPDIKNEIHHMKPGECLEFQGVEIETLLSTDEGVAFLVTYAGKTIYHAGDLHWWHWDGAEELVNQYQEKTYKRQIDKLAEKKIDLAFVVIDSRLEEALYWGMDYFMEHVQARWVIPMHLWQNYELITEYKKKIAQEDYANSVLEVTKENQVFEME